MSSLVSVGFVALVLLYFAFTAARGLKRRSALRASAADHNLTARGTIPSDKYPPYVNFDIVRRGVLLHNVIEGRWDDVEVALFDVPKRGGSFTGVIASLAGDGGRYDFVRDNLGSSSDVRIIEAIPGAAAAAIGRHTQSLLESGPRVRVETAIDHLLVSTMRPLAPEGLPSFLTFVVSLVRALDADARGHGA